MKPITNTVELAERIISEAFKDKTYKGGRPYYAVSQKKANALQSLDEFL